MLACWLPGWLVLFLGMYSDKKRWTSVSLAFSWCSDWGMRDLVVVACFSLCKCRWSAVFQYLHLRIVRAVVQFSERCHVGKPPEFIATNANVWLTCFVTGLWIVCSIGEVQILWQLSPPPVVQQEHFGLKGLRLSFPIALATRSQTIQSPQASLTRVTQHTNSENLGVWGPLRQPAKQHIPEVKCFPAVGFPFLARWSVAVLVRNLPWSWSVVRQGLTEKHLPDIFLRQRALQKPFHKTTRSVLLHHKLFTSEDFRLGITHTRQFYTWTIGHESFQTPISWPHKSSQRFPFALREGALHKHFWENS